MAHVQMSIDEVAKVKKARALVKELNEAIRDLTAAKIGTKIEVVGSFTIRTTFVVLVDKVSIGE